MTNKVDFNGVTRQITVTPGVSTIDVKVDIYSSWKEWSQLYDNTKFPPALRAIGGDPIGQGLFAGDIYFLINGWQVVINQKVQVNGVLYNDTPSLDPYLVNSGGGVISNVSNLVQTVSIPTTEQIVAAILAAAQADPIHSDARRMNGANIDGTGTESDKWRGSDV